MTKILNIHNISLQGKFLVQQNLSSNHTLILIVCIHLKQCLYLCLKLEILFKGSVIKASVTVISYMLQK